MLSNWCHYKVTGDAKFGRLRKLGDVSSRCERTETDAHTNSADIIARS